MPEYNESSNPSCKDGVLACYFLFAPCSPITVRMCTPYDDRDVKLSGRLQDMSGDSNR